jgi:hypothetical protein
LEELDINYVEFRLPLHDLEGIRKLSDCEGYMIDRASIERELLVKKK